MRIAIVDDAGNAVTAALPPNQTDTVLGYDHELLGDPFAGTMVVEGVWSGDRRLWAEGATSWRPLPLPFMGLQTNTFGHQEAEVAGIILTMERVGAEIRFAGRWLKTNFGESQRLMWESGAIRGVSGDWDDYELEVLVPESQFASLDEDTEPVEAQTETIDGETFEVVKIPYTRERYTKVRAIGATAVPFPAFKEGQLDPPALVAAGELSPSGQLITGWLDCACDDDTDESNTALVASLVASSSQVTERIDPPAAKIEAADGHVNLPVDFATDEHPIKPPMAPPPGWLEYDTDYLGTDLIPPTVTNEGRMFGYLAGWGTCHIGFPDTCVTPPQSATSYAHFMTGEIVLADGSRSPVGQITLGRGHADLGLSPAAAKAHYDDTCTAVADVFVGEDELGIWIAGAARPDITALDMRRLVASDLSGDWRKIGRNLELVAALGVNVPGFHKGPRPSLKTRIAQGVVTAMIASIPPGSSFAPAKMKLIETAEDIAISLLAEHVEAARRSSIAELEAMIGRTTDERLAELVGQMEAMR